MIKGILRNFPGIGWLREGWPDEARFVVQSAALLRVLAGRQLKGDCLDAGCGEGLYGSLLDSYPDLRRIVHMDVVRPSVATRFPNRRHEDHAGSVTEVPFDREEFDFCICTEVMEHVTDDDRGFAELARVIKPNGLLLISTPTPPAPFDPNHVREGYTFDEMHTHLRRHGFEVLSHTFCFHLTMRIFLIIWRWQFKALGRAKRSWIPRFLVYFVGVLDRSIPFGKPWDIVVLARRRTAGNI